MHEWVSKGKWLSFLFLYIDLSKHSYGNSLFHDISYIWHVCFYSDFSKIWILLLVHQLNIKHPPENKVRGANMEPIWGRQDPDGPHVDPMNFAIWDHL